MPSKTWQEYTAGQLLGEYGCKYLRESKHIPRTSSSGYPFMERHAFFECGRCGKEFTAHIGKVKTGWTKSCGCRKLTSDGISTLPSGERDPLHVVWARMNERCYDPKAINYRLYGERGISVCEEWRKSFKSFRTWAINNGHELGLQIDRIDNNGNYCPENCRFVTNKENSKNKRNNRHCWLDGEKIIFSEAAERLGVSCETIRAWSKQDINSRKFRKRPLSLVFEEPINV